MTDTSRFGDVRDEARELFACAADVLPCDAPQSRCDGNEFASRLEAAKLEALAEFAAGAGHEINNPLATISGRVQMLLKDETDPERRQSLLTIGGQALRIRDMIGDLMLFGRPPRPRPERLVLRDVVRSAVETMREEAARGACGVCLDEPPPVEALADPVQLKIVVGCLIRNALEAQRNGGEIRVAVTSALLDGRAAGLLSVSDFGPGLTELERAHLFDPFFSGRPAGRGPGFGTS